MKLGTTADNFGIEMDLSDADVITDVIVITKVLGEDGRVYLCMAVSEGTDWLTVRAMTEDAYNQARSDESEDG